MIREWMDEYKPSNEQEAVQALREIMQEIALASMARAGFFDEAAFYGGTALRIFYDLDRYSEDLDFSLLYPEPGFQLDSYLSAIEQEFAALGMRVSIREKNKKIQTNMESAFLKSDTEWKEIILEGAIPQVRLPVKPSLKIKLEIDTKPPPGFRTEDKLLLKPYTVYVRCFRLPDLFAGKMQALLFRKWGTNVKGRDWYDMEWYIRKSVPLRLSHLAERAYASGDIKQRSLTEAEFKTLLSSRIDVVNMDKVRTDMLRFLSDPAKIAQWSAKYFHDLSEKIKVDLS